MNKPAHWSYSAPEIQELAVMVEQGFAASDDYGYDIDSPSENDYGSF